MNGSDAMVRPEASSFVEVGLGTLKKVVLGLIPGSAQHARRAVGFALFAGVAAEAVTLSSGLLPSLLSTAVLAMHPAEATATPLAYWATFRFGMSETLAVVTLLAALGASWWAAAGSDVALWGVALLRRETDPRRAAWLAAAIAVLAVDAVWRLKVLSLPGTHPTAFRILAAAAAAGVFLHMMVRIRALTHENLSLHGPVLAVLLTLLAYGMAASALAQIADLADIYPTDFGVLKPLQWAASALLVLLVAGYSYCTLLTQSPAAAGVPASPSVASAPRSRDALGHRRINAGILLQYGKVFELRGDGTPFVVYTPPKSHDLVRAVATFDPNDTGLLAYREDPDARRFDRQHEPYLDLSSLTYLLIDTHAIPLAYHGRVAIGPEETRFEWVSGELTWQLNLYRGNAPETISATAWQDLNDLLVNRKIIADSVSHQIRRRLCELSGAFQATTPERVIDRLLRMQGLAHGDALTVVLPGPSAKPEDRLVALATGLARRAIQRHALERWAEQVDAEVDGVLAMVGGLDDRFAIETLATALRRIRQPEHPEAPPSELGRLLRRFNYTPLSGERELRLTPKARELLDLTSSTVRAWVSATEADFAKQAELYREQLALVRDKDRAEMLCAHEVKKAVADGLFSDSTLPIVMARYPIVAVAERVVGLGRASDTSTATDPSPVDEEGAGMPA